MKKRFLNCLAFALLSFVLVSCGSKEQKVLTVYYSHWGNTDILADMIHQSVGGDIFRIELENPYPAEGTHAAVQKDIDAGTMPVLKNKVNNLDSYDIIFIGTPNWFSTMSLPVEAFLQENTLSGKTVIPFATYGGSAGNTLTDIAKAIPNAHVLDGFAVSGDEVKQSKEAVQERMDQWINALPLELKAKK
ncbi:MAG: flavodoxin [Bacteroides sp.]|nr:flavodoxin [Bacteroides sp.]